MIEISNHKTQELGHKVLSLARHPLLKPRLDGKLPIQGSMTALMQFDDAKDKVSRLTIVFAGVEALEIFDFRGEGGFKLFRVRHHEAMAAAEVTRLMTKLERLFETALTQLEERKRASESAAIQGGLSEFMKAEIRQPPTQSGASPQGATPQLEDQRFRLEHSDEPKAGFI